MPISILYHIIRVKQFIVIITVFLCTFNSSLNIYAQEEKYSEKKFKTKFTASHIENVPVRLIPFPQKISWNNSQLVITGLNIQNSDKIAPLLLKEIKQICAENNIQLNKNKHFRLSLVHKEKLNEEAYRLKTTNSRIQIAASTNTGFFYALQTLRQLITNENNSCKIHLCQIEDEPHFPIRGFMIDVGRNYQSIQLLKKQLDIMAKYKLNTFQWHLTDNPAWRIESKMYSELTEAKNHRPSRNPGKYYTYEEIRDLIKYANEKHITVIPEIDMPGHSDSFIKSMGCRMESPEGMKILENVLHEFFREIPKEIAPLIHLGSDEVKINNSEAFVSKMVRIVENDNRKAIVWTPGLNTKQSVIKQAWGRKKEQIEGYTEIDSKFSYINNVEPMSGINQLFFRPIGGDSKNDVLGGILCLWPDVNVWSENDIYLQHPVYSSMLTYAWASWTADVISSPQSFQTNLPVVNSSAINYFASFENYLMDHKFRFFNHLPFFYAIQSDKLWQLIGPFDKNDGDHILQSDSDIIQYKGNNMTWKEARGNTLTINSRDTHLGHYAEAKPGQIVFARTFIHSDSDKSIMAYINFESPLRANRVYTGIAQNGSWDINGGKIWVNNIILKGPKWDNPGWKPFKQKGWATGIDKEIPWTDEELYWLRKPATIQLKKGWNKIIVKIPCSTKHQNWMFTFVPIDMNGIRFSTHKY